MKNEMSRYLSASWETFGKRKVLAIQCVNNTITLMCSKRVDNNKWAIVEQRSAAIPRDRDDRFYWIKVIELLVKLNVNFLLEYMPWHMMFTDWVIGFIGWTGENYRKVEETRNRDNPSWRLGYHKKCIKWSYLQLTDINFDSST